MLKARSEFITGGAQLLDCSVIILSAVVAHRAYMGFWQPNGSCILLISIVVLLSIFTFQQFNLYKAWRGSSVYKEIGIITLSWATVVLTTTAFAFANKLGALYSRGWVAIWVFGAWVGFVSSHTALRFMLGSLRRRGYNTKRVIIVGYRDFSERVANKVLASPWMGFGIQGIFLTNPADSADPVGNIPMLGGIGDVAEYAQTHDVDQVWLAMPLRDELDVRYILYALRHSTADIRMLPDIFSFQLLNHSISEVAGFPVLDLSVSTITGMNFILKTLLDMILALIALLLASPIMLMIAIGVKLSSYGPVLFKQGRLGMDGKLFIVYKFRTMFLHEEKQGELIQATRNDPRVTRLGGLLRRTSLDELPQLFNVLRGEMSLVGPRPHALEHNELYKNVVERYMLRHKVKPGMTGWAQVNGWRGESDTLEKMQKRVEFDLYYIENWSVFLDIWIMLLTIVRSLRGTNAY